MKKSLGIIFLIISIFNPILAVENPLIFGKARFTVIAPELIRMEFATDSQFVDAPSLFAMNRTALSDAHTVTQVGNKYTIKTSRMEVRYVADNKPFSQKNIQITVYNQPKNYEWRIYSRDNKNLGGTLSTLDEIDGEVSTTPGLLSRNGWQLIDDTGKEIFINNWIAERPINHQRDLYFFAYGQDYKAALKALTTISGEIPINRKYVHGVWYCRWWNYTAQDFLDIVQGYKEHDFPLDILVMDMGWHTQKEATTGMGHAGQYGWTGYTWNKNLIPNPKRLIQTLHDDNIYVALNDHPHDGIRKHEAYYSPFMQAMGVDTINSNELLFNAGERKYMDNFFKYALKPSEDLGVDFWWLDWQQDYVIPKVLGYKNLNHLNWLNELYFKHSQEKGQRGLTFSRWAGLGSQRTPIQFSGDCASNWNVLKFEIPFTTSSGNAGCFFWAHDVGGFYGGDRNPELYVRWSQFALTTSSLRIHSVNDENLDRRPWLWGEQAEKALRQIYHLRSELMPYVYSSVYQSHSQSLPLLRGMYIEYPDLEEAYNQSQQYLFGDLLLAAPIVSPGVGETFVASQNVWFPPKAVWYDIFTNEKYEGGQTIEVKKDIYSTPLFVKGGTPLPMQPYTQRAASVPDTIVLRCYPGIVGETGSYELYEDDGISQDYKNGAYRLTKLSYTQQTANKAVINVEKMSGKGYKGEPKNRIYKVVLPMANKETNYILKVFHKSDNQN
ncbi:MAG: glycoside hydrolase family 31 protein [Candidatus Symbiothrix sp.]|jgi:alpha-glucosidase (family GH31 glycosyl hydrolase)|nr:glycoside hydrolase family 31 protein [Candidatus Symbiothrix sp.]